MVKGIMPDSAPLIGLGRILCNPIMTRGKLKSARVWRQSGYMSMRAYDHNILHCCVDVLQQCKSNDEDEVTIYNNVV